MPHFSKKSKKRLSTCRQELQDIFNEVIKFYDCSILEGHRGQEAQDKYFNEGKSQIKWPHGKHNKIPSLAIDAVPYPIDWTNIKEFCYLAGLVEGIASQMGYKIRWGGRWKSLRDYPHYELKE